jgi:MFS superfamily sulfate permease-like transporter
MMPTRGRTAAAFRPAAVLLPGSNEILAGLTTALALVPEVVALALLAHLSPDCRQLLQNAGALIEVNILEDPKYQVATPAG